jgi:hypothetical protein
MKEKKQHITEVAEEQKLKPFKISHYIAKEQDIEVLSSLYVSAKNANENKENLAMAKQYFTDILTKLNFNVHVIVYEIEEHKIPIGYISFTNSYNLDIHLIDFVCANDSLGTDIITQILKSILKQYKDIGVKYCLVSVPSKTQPIIDLYKKMNFIVLSVREDFYPNKDKALFMELCL